MSPIPLWHIAACAVALLALIGLTVYAAAGIRAQRREFEDENPSEPQYRRKR